MKHRLVQLTLLGIAIATFVTVACNPAQPPTPPPTDTPPPTATPPPTNTPRPEPTPTMPPTETPTATPVPPSPTPQPLRLTSAGFDPGGMIPEKYAYHGGNLSPPLEWSDPPEGTQSFALLVISDPMPDGGGNWVLWAFYNIPAETRALPEGLTPDDASKLPNGSQHLENSWAQLKYGGPTPGHLATRCFYFTLYALDTLLDPDVVNSMEATSWFSTGQEKLLQAIEGHVLAQGELMGKYKGE